MSKREPFSDRLKPEQVQQVLDALGLPWREYYNPDNKGWVNMPNDFMFSDLSVNIEHGGFVNQHADGMIKTYNSHDYLPARGDLVTLVMFLKFGLNDEDKAIQCIKQVLDMKPNRSKVHIFHVEDAINYGVKGAVILQNIRTWLDVNLAKNHNIREGRVWTYDTQEAFTNYHPYLKKHQIRYELEKLEEDGILLARKLEKSQWNQTLWYSINELKYAFKANEPNRENSQLEARIFSNQN